MIRVNVYNDETKAFIDSSQVEETREIKRRTGLPQATDVMQCNKGLLRVLYRRLPCRLIGVLTPLHQNTAVALPS